MLAVPTPSKLIHGHPNLDKDDGDQVELWQAINALLNEPQKTCSPLLLSGAQQYGIIK